MLVSAVMEETASGKADVICMSSVASEDMQTEERLRSVCRRFVKVDASVRMPLVIDYDTPETLGADRIAAALGASLLFPGQDCLIFDFGTAITVDYVSADGRFTGGNISPGLSMRLEAMHGHTSRLPLVTPADPVRMYGRSTVEAVSNGAVLGIMFEVERYIASNPGCRIIFTGGDSLFFAKKLKSSIFVICNLVLTGLSKMALLNNV